MKRLKGKKTDSNHHLKVNNTNITNNEEKEIIFRNIWEDVFSITHE